MNDERKVFRKAMEKPVKKQMSMSGKLELVCSLEGRLLLYH